MKTKFLRSVLHLPLLNAMLLLIALATGANAQTLVWQENWESPAAQDDWYADNGVWEIGQPTSGPGAAPGGANCAATVLAGDYADDRQSRLVSPPILVPVAELNPRLRFWHWCSFGALDFGQVQISTDNGVSRQPLSSEYGEDGVANIYDSSGRWSRAWLYLGGYAGQTVPLGFYLESNTTPVVGVTVSSGWYVDETHSGHLENANPYS
jgi:hypothetical protein